MSSFSCDEKRHVKIFVLKNSVEGQSMENEEKWKELGCQINRDWKEIREAYDQGKMDEDAKVLSEEIKNQEDLNILTCVEDCNFTESFNEKNIINGYEGEIEYVNLNGKLYEVNNYENYVLQDTEVFNTAVYNDDGVVEISKKRQLDLNDFDVELLKTFELQSNEELELKRKEHEKKMKLYKMQLDFAAEVHQEKMKILKTKLQVIQEQLYHIDHVICNNNLKRRFKSGPI